MKSPLSLAVPIVALLVLVGFTGCASRKQIVDLQSDVWQIDTKIDSLYAQNKRMSQTVAGLGEDVRNMSAKSEFGSTALEEKVQSLAARLDDILNRMDRSLAPMEDWIRKQNASDTSQSTQLGIDYYDAAQRDLGLGNYDLAEVGFLQFLEMNSSGELADEARYGLGESYYARKRYDEAIEEYQRVIELDPLGTNVPRAMLKLGLCYRAVQNMSAARRQWEDLVEQFPQSEEAGIAKQRLSELKGRH